MYFEVELPVTIENNEELSKIKEESIVKSGLLK
jgi:hypothetical protein